MPEVPAVSCVVDDDAMVRTALTRLLRAAGCPTEAFASAEAFLRRPHREVCTGLILDVDLPDHSGRKLAHSTTAAKSHMPIIVLTAREPSAADACPRRAVA